MKKSRSATAPVPRISFALEHLDKVCWTRRHGLGVFALAVTSYTGPRGIAKGRYLTYYVLFYERLLTRDRPFEEGALQADRPDACCPDHNLAGFGCTGPDVLKGTEGRPGLWACNVGVPQVPEYQRSRKLNRQEGMKRAGAVRLQLSYLPNT